MTRPIRPTSAFSEVRATRKGVESLAKRPAPVVESSGFVPGVEFAAFSSSTDWGTSFTTLSFGATFWRMGEPFTGVDTYELSGGTLSGAGTGNLRIRKDGAYRIEVAFTNYTNNAAVSTKRLLEARIIAGEGASGYGPSWSTVGHGAEVPTRIQDAQAGGIIDIYPVWWPAYSDFLYYDDGTFDGTNYSEIRIRAFKEEDEVGVAETTVVTYMLITRIGGPWIDP